MRRNRPRHDTASLTTVVSITTISASLMACYSPVVTEQSSMSGADTDASGTGAATEGGETEAATTTGVPTTDDPTTTGVSLDTTVADVDTAATDAPPTFEAFTVNGSTTPPEVDEGGTIMLEADVTDDVGVVSVEFFDGANSLGTVTDTTFELEILVSSADSGAHSYTAIATDTADQTTESDEVTLSVNIVGGEVLFYRESLFVSSSGLGGAGVSIMTTEGGRVVVNGLIANAISGRVLTFNEDLSSLWSDNEDALVKAKAVDLGQEILISSWLDGEWTYTRRALDSSAPAGNISVNVPAGDPVVALLGSRAVRGGQGVVLTTLPNAVRTYPTSLGSPGWSLALPSSAVVSDLDSLPGGAVLMTFSDDAQCAPGSQTCLRRIEPDGSVDWTVGFGSDVVAATRENQHVIAVSARPMGGSRMRSSRTQAVRSARSSSSTPTGSTLPSTMSRTMAREA